MTRNRRRRGARCAPARRDGSASGAATPKAPIAVNSAADMATVVALASVSASDSAAPSDSAAILGFAPARKMPSPPDRDAVRLSSASIHGAGRLPTSVSADPERTATKRNTTPRVISASASQSGSASEIPVTSTSTTNSRASAPTPTTQPARKENPFASRPGRSEEQDDRPDRNRAQGDRHRIDQRFAHGRTLPDAGRIRPPGRPPRSRSRAGGPGPRSARALPGDGPDP